MSGRVVGMVDGYWEDLVRWMVMGVAYQAMAVGLILGGAVGIAVLPAALSVYFLGPSGWRAARYRRVSPWVSTLLAVLPLGVWGLWLIPWRMEENRRRGFEVLGGVE